jgi:hypothetical protein
MQVDVIRCMFDKKAMFTCLMRSSTPFFGIRLNSINNSLIINYDILEA